MTDISAIRRFNRFELKYLLTLQQAEEFRSGLRAYLVPDEHGNNGRYTLASLYYDSPGLRCFWEKMDGIKFRRKLRIRHYESDEPFTRETTVFVEIKQRIDRVTQKRRVILPYAEAVRLCNDRQIPDHEADDAATMEEIDVLLWQYNLRPVSIVRYERQAFVGTDYDIGLRVTFDTSLAFEAQQLHLHEQPPGLPMVSPNLVVMEIKINERMPYWLTEMLAAHNMQIIRISKYCRSIEAAQNMPTRQWRYLAPEPSEDVLSSLPSALRVLERENVRSKGSKQTRTMGGSKWTSLH